MAIWRVGRCRIGLVSPLRFKLAISPGYRLAMWCDSDLAIAIAIANQDHGLDGYVGEAWILILILAIASPVSTWS